MSEIRRLNISNPAANIATDIFTVTGHYLISVIAANTSTSSITKVDIWIAPNNTGTESNWGYIIKNASIEPGNSLETFRFAASNNDRIYVKSNNGNASFTIVGINQS